MTREQAKKQRKIMLKKGRVASMIGTAAFIGFFILCIVTATYTCVPADSFCTEKSKLIVCEIPVTERSWRWGPHWGSLWKMYQRVTGSFSFNNLRNGFGWTYLDCVCSSSKIFYDQRRNSSIRPSNGIVIYTSMTSNYL